MGSVAKYAVRTPDEAFEGLSEYPFTPKYRQAGDLRLAYLDEGDPSGEPVVLWHGEPTWSYLWRKVIPPLVDAGYRCIAPDLPGFGRSDKPTDLAWHAYDTHAALAGSLFTDLDLRGATVVAHDWGGPIGLRAAVEQADHVERLVIMDTGLFTGRQRMSDAWETFRGFVEKTEDLPIGMLVRGGCHTDPGDAVIAAYDAPFPDASYKAGTRALPLLIPLTPDAPGARAGETTLAALRESTWPTLMLWADSDPVLPLKAGEAFASAIGRPAPEVIPDASHFLQEDQGELIGRRIADWLASA
jgi:haloalkane dehalogenase